MDYANVTGNVITATATVSNASVSTGLSVTGTVATGGKGADGSPGQGIAKGGSAGQVLVKVDGSDYNTQWTTLIQNGSATSLVLTDTTGQPWTLSVLTNGALVTTSGTGGSGSTTPPGYTSAYASVYGNAA